MLDAYIFPNNNNVFSCVLFSDIFQITFLFYTNKTNFIAKIYRYVSRTRDTFQSCEPFFSVYINLPTLYINYLVSIFYTYMMCTLYTYLLNQTMGINKKSTVLVDELCALLHTIWVGYTSKD